MITAITVPRPAPKANDLRVATGAGITANDLRKKERA